MDAVECLHQMTSELGGKVNRDHSEWALGERPRIPCGRRRLRTFYSDFRRRSFNKLEHLGDTAVDARRYDEAISLYSTALSLNLPSPQGILIKRSKAHVATGSWKQAVDDANRVHHFCLVELNLVDPSPGNHTRSVVAMGLRDEACSFTQGKRFRQCG